jgi:hypothetical protein
LSNLINQSYQQDGNINNLEEVVANTDADNNEYYGYVKTNLAIDSLDIGK